MTIDQALFEYIKNYIPYTGTLYYGTAEGATGPYIVITKITDPERPNVLCNMQGESGEALFQFFGVTGGSNASASDASDALIYIDNLKENVKYIKGEIGAAPNNFRINGNFCTGARMINLGIDDNAWNAFFELTILWERA